MAVTLVKLLICAFILLQNSEAKDYLQPAGKDNRTCVDYFDCYDDEYMPHKFHITLEETGYAGCEDPHKVKCLNLEPPIQPPSSSTSCGFHDFHTFQWSAQLLIRRDPYVVYAFKCAISFIHERVAITTAFCLQEKGEFLVRVGTASRNITKIHKHPKFNASTFKNDIAVLFLEEAFDRSEISVVCMPQNDMDLAGYNCTTAPKSKVRRTGMNVMTVPLMTTEECVRRFKNTTYDIYVSNAHVICVEDEGPRGYCGEDGGGPLFCPMGEFADRYQLVGLGAWSTGCVKDVPRVYVNLMLVREWIDEVMVENGFKIVDDEDGVHRRYVE